MIRQVDVKDTDIAQAKGWRGVEDVIQAEAEMPAVVSEAGAIASLEPRIGQPYAALQISIAANPPQAVRPTEIIEIPRHHNTHRSRP